MKLKKFYNNLCTNGIFFPYAFDPTTKKPSITLLMLYFATLIMFSAVITNLFVNILSSTLVTILIWWSAFLMYRLRKIDKLKIDLNDQEIEIESSNEQEEK